MIDFVFASAVFLALFFFLTSEYYRTMELVSQEQELRETKTAAEQSLDALIRTRGHPVRWENLDIDDVNELGLATQDRVLSEAKALKLQQWSSDWNATKTNYEKVKDKLNLGGYEFFVSLHGNPDINMGWEQDLNKTAVNLTRVVTFKGNVARIEFKLYSRR